MGLSLTSALVGLGLLLIGITLLILHRQRKLAIALVIVGIVFMVVPYGTIYFFLD